MPRGRRASRRYDDDSYGYDEDVRQGRRDERRGIIKCVDYVCVNVNVKVVGGQ